MPVLLARQPPLLPRFGFAFTLLKPAAGAASQSAAYYCFRIHSWILADYLTMQGQGGKVQSRESIKRTIRVGFRLVS